MADESMKVSFIGDASSLEAASAKSVAAIDNVTKSTSKVSQALAQSSASMARNAANMGGSIAKGAGTATFAMTNLGRVLQDAPYGFLGIANNLNPLLESFQRLKAETGSVGGAIKALGGSLLGGGGLGIALSAITAAVQFAQLGFSMWSRGMSKAKDEEDDLAKKTEETQKRIKELTKSLSEVKVDVRAQAVGDTQGEVEKVRALASVIQDQTKSYTQRNNALKELQGINKNYFGDLTLESASLKDLKDRVDEYSQAIISAAIVKEFASDIAKVSKEIVMQRGEIDKGVNSIADLSTALKLAKERNTDLRSKELGYTTQEISSAQNRFGKAVALVKEQSQALSKLGEQKTLLTKALNDALGESLKFKPLDVKTEGGNKSKPEFGFLFDFLPFDPSGKLKPEQKAKVLDAADRFSKEFQGIFKGLDFATKAKSEDEKIKLALKFDADLKAGNIKFDLSKIKEATEKAIKPEDMLPALDKFTETLPQLVVDQFVRGFQNAQESLKGKNIFGDLSAAVIDSPEKALAGLKDKLKQIGEALPQTFEATNIFGQKVTVTLEDLMDFTKISPGEAIRVLQNVFGGIVSELDKQKEAINSAISSFSADAFSGIGEGIGEAIASGAGAIQTAANSIGQAMGALVQQIGKALIQYGIVKTGLDKVIKSGFALPGAAAIAIGVGAIAVGALIKASFANVKKFAQGGLAFGPTLGLVGEGVGTSRTNPEVIAPLDKLKDFIKPSSDGFPEYLPAINISYDQFRVIYKRAFKQGNIFGG